MKSPLVIDARDVLEDPKRVLTLLCQAVGVDFTERMLSWEPGLRDTDGSRDAEQIIALAIETVRTLSIPHFDTIDDEVVDGEVIH